MLQRLSENWPWMVRKPLTEERKGEHFGRAICPQTAEAQYAVPSQVKVRKTNYG